MIDDESASGQWGYIASARHGDESAVGNDESALACDDSGMG